MCIFNILESKKGSVQRAIKWSLNIVICFSVALNNNNIVYLILRDQIELTMKVLDIFEFLEGA